MFNCKIMALFSSNLLEIWQEKIPKWYLQNPYPKMFKFKII